MIVVFAGASNVISFKSLLAVELMGIRFAAGESDKTTIMVYVTYLIHSE